MKTVLKIFGWIVGLLTISLLTMLVIGQVYSIPEETLFADICKIGICVWAFLTLCLCGILVLDEIKDI